jgi:hypothetical protein
MLRTRSERDERDLAFPVLNRHATVGRDRTSSRDVAIKRRGPASSLRHESIQAVTLRYGIYKRDSRDTVESTCALHDLVS